MSQDSIVSITSEQLKYTNLIFVEHKNLLEENKLLNQQISNYQLKVNYLLKTDSLRLSQIEEYKSINDNYVKQIKDLNSDIKKKKRSITYLEIGGITITASLVIFLLLK